MICPRAKSRPRFTADGPRLTADGPRLTADGPRLTADGPRLTADGLQLTADGLQLTADGPQLAADSRRLTADGLTPCCSFHSLRHFFITELFRNGVPAPAVQRLAGHAELTTTQLYADMVASDLKAAIATFSVAGGAEARALPSWGLLVFRSLSIT